MAKKYRILIVTPELAPYAKTGGLADMVAALADQIKRKGHDVRIVLPFYAVVRQAGVSCTTLLDSMCVTMGIGEEWCAVRHCETGTGVPVYLIEHDSFFGRQGLYHDERYVDYYDNPRRFGFFSRAALQVVLDTGFKPDIIQVNDWQTALVPAYLKTWFWDNPVLGRCASVLTIHNAAYQGAYSAYDYQWLGLRKDHFVVDIFEDYGRMNLLKGGIYFSDAVNTVSPTHAREISSPHGGFGLAPYLSNKGDAFCGILNGVDYSVWSPENDPKIPAGYTRKDMSGKKICKKNLQKRFLLKEDPNIPLIGLVGRFAAQKGYTLVRDVIERVVTDMVVQCVILGSGDQGMENYFGGLPAKYPGVIGTRIGFDDALAHGIEAGADFFLMPSLYEPCGLNQLYSLRYGTLPIVRATGGLHDTIENYDEASGSGTGFKFYDDTSIALYYTIGWAVSTWYDRPLHMKNMIDQAMSRDFSWDRSTKRYLALFKKAMDIKKAYDASFVRG